MMPKNVLAWLHKRNDRRRPEGKENRTCQTATGARTIGPMRARPFTPFQAIAPAPRERAEVGRVTAPVGCAR